jgi:hypothetical protein
MSFWRWVSKRKNLLPANSDLSLNVSVLVHREGFQSDGACETFIHIYFQFCRRWGVTILNLNLGVCICTITRVLQLVPEDRTVSPFTAVDVVSVRNMFVVVTVYASWSVWASVAPLPVMVLSCALVVPDALVVKRNCTLRWRVWFNIKTFDSSQLAGKNFFSRVQQCGVRGGSTRRNVYPVRNSHRVLSV